MRVRVLNYRTTASHDSISTLNYINTPLSISDFHAFIYDPIGLDSDSPSLHDFQRRQIESRDLIHRKGGIVVCILRPEPQGAKFSRYGLLHLAATSVVGLLQSTISTGKVPNS